MLLYQLFTPSRPISYLSFTKPDYIYLPISITAVLYRNPGLTLPCNWRIHNVFHVSLLEPYRRSALRESPDAEKFLHETDDIEYSEEYDVDEVMAATQRTKKSRVMYVVKWLDYPARKDWTQEPYESFSVGGQEKLVIFHTKFPDSPRDPRLIMP